MKAKFMTLLLTLFSIMFISVEYATGNFLYDPEFHYNEAQVTPSEGAIFDKAACTPPWQPAQYQQNNMNVIAKLYLSGVLSTNAFDAIGAFVGTECRGIGHPDPSLGGMLFLTITSNVTSGETVTFKSWNSSTCQECTLPETMPFVAQSEVGTMANPFLFHCECTSVLSVLPSSQNAASTAGSTTFTISTSGCGTLLWTASSNQTWCTLSPASGTGNSTLTADFTENTTCTSRTATITITATGSTGSPATVTVVQAANTVPAKLYLEGALVNAENASVFSIPMRTTLNDKRMLPGQTYQASSGIVYTPPGQPYNIAPWNYNGTEGAAYDSQGDPANGSAGYPTDVVDWVLVSLRTTNDANYQTVCRKAALLHKDGRIELLSGFGDCGADPSQSYYLVVEHRNHLLVMSHIPVLAASGSMVYDFTIQQSYRDPAKPAYVGQKQMGTNFALLAGNGNQSSTPASDTDINSDDHSFWETENGLIGYKRGDFNLNGDTNSNDPTLWVMNNGLTTGVVRFSASIPSVITNDITWFSNVEAIGGGNVLSDGGAVITQKGLCWNTSQNPTINHSKTENGPGTGFFLTVFSGLRASTLYYVRAYATNMTGTAYGDQISFTTSPARLPEISTLPLINITQTSVTTGGEITADGGDSVSVRGVCWSAFHLPTVDDYKTMDGSGIGSYISNVTGLASNTKYLIRAYAKNGAGIQYASGFEFTTKALEISTNKVTNITQTTASSGGSIISDIGATITAKGVCWSTSLDPTISDSKTDDGSGNESFISNLTGLTANTLYYVRAYYTNSLGTTYGKNISFITNGAEGQSDRISDIDGNVYNTIIIGTQQWMKENLRTTKYNDGYPIPNIADAATWDNTFQDAYCWYNNDMSNKIPYGALYNYKVISTNKICPDGWHVPSDDEWKALETFLGMPGSELDNYGPRGTGVGNKLKEAGCDHWYCPDWGPNMGTNESGFTALPGGSHLQSGYGFTGIKEAGWWWGSDSSVRILDHNYNTVTRNFFYPNNGLSVRCLKD